MTNRWQMNRMGFINFWLYDEEIFTFSDGRLLLRGANASGKSITTQSMIPFILDGDRTPGRLDPFGSADRKMEYYFLGNGEREDVTGYLFLEFKKQGIEQYRTIGIGQHAQKGKPMDFWGFVVLDNRRIGYDFQLYKEVGDKKIPHTRQILKNTLGDNNPLVTKQREYMELVNKYLFGFPRLEQYEQFIQLMIKVRSPKLSRDFKPSKIYEILNESLQTLSDADLRPMVEAMEKMDDIQAHLEGLKAAFKSLQVMKREYDKYSAYILAQKGKALLQCHDNVLQLEQEISSAERELSNDTAEQEKKTRQNEAMEVETKTLLQEKELLHMDSIQDSIDRLEQRRKEREEQKNGETEIQQKITVNEDKICQLDTYIQTISDMMAACEKAARVQMDRLDLLNEDIHFERHVEIERIMPACQETADVNMRTKILTDVQNSLQDLGKAIRNGLDVLREVAGLAEELSRQEEVLSRLKTKRDDTAEQLAKAQQIEDGCRDQLIEDFSVLPGTLTELPVTKEDVEKLSACITTYQGLQDYEPCRRILAACRDWRKDEISRDKAENNAALKNITKEIKQISDELEQLRQITEAVPDRPAKVVEARRILQQAGIDFLPFYEAVEFNENTSAEQQAVLEMQLTDAGLLDALVVAPKDRDKAEELLNDISDCLIETDVRPAADCMRELVPEDSTTQIGTVTAVILRGISVTDDPESSVVIRPDGYYRHGLLEGHSIPERSAVYLGRKARQEALQRQITEKEEEFQTRTEQAEAYRMQLRKLDESEEKLNDEYMNMPSFSDLDQSIGITADEKYQYERLNDSVTAQEAAVQKLHDRKQESDRKVLAVCKALPYSRTIDAYSHASNAAQEYEQKLRSVSQQISIWGTKQLERDRVNETRQVQAGFREEMTDRLKQQRQTLQILEAEISDLEKIVHSPENLEKAKRYEEIAERLRKIDERSQANRERLAQLQILIENCTDRLDEKKKNISGAENKRRTAQDYFYEDAKISLADDMKEQDGNVLDTLLITAKTAAVIPDTLANKTLSDMVASLHNIYQVQSGNLTEYGTALENYFDEDSSGYGLLRRRFRIASVWQGKKLYIREFHQVLSGSIESMELLIREKDRELFENILADTLSRKLSNRIAESKKWIADMSKLMMQMDTSMGLNFSMTWKPCQRENEEELDVAELEKLLSRDINLLTQADIDKVALHFRSRIRREKQVLEERGAIPNYADLVRDALDYRQWYEFRMFFYRPTEARRELTNSAFNKFSGGEKAMAMYVPLFAAVNAQYRKSESKEHPRIIALDEAFAGVDDRNISSMFALVQQLDFDYIMNSQALWGCYDTVRRLRISELLRPANADIVTVINYDWNGRERSLA